MFMVTCLLLAKLSTIHTDESLMGDEATTEEKADDTKTKTESTEDKHKRDKRLNKTDKEEDKGE